MTITLSEERRKAVKEAAARRGVSITELIDESLELAGVRTQEDAANIVARARAQSGLSDAEAMDLALRETAAVRGQPS
jgi:ribosome-binding protein aMBF1 (putative translation factor)